MLENQTMPPQPSGVRRASAGLRANEIRAGDEVARRTLQDAIDRSSGVNGQLGLLVEAFQAQARRLGGDFPLGAGGFDKEVPDGQVAMLHAAFDVADTYLGQLHQILSALERV